MPSYVGSGLNRRVILCTFNDRAGAMHCTLLESTTWVNVVEQDSCSRQSNSSSKVI